LAGVFLLAVALPAVAEQTIYQDLFNDPQNINRGGRLMFCGSLKRS